MNKLSYKGYNGTIEASIEDSCLHGKILFIDDIITYEGNTVDDIKISFKQAVDHYLAYCKESGKAANKPFSGTFNVRVGQELHKKAAETAFHRGITLNEFVTQSIQAAIEQNEVVKFEYTHNYNIILTEKQTSATMFAPTEQPHKWETFNAFN
ncbi:MAG TPA: type II toxin-antitoxin system HicB family antitoxin [Desulfobacteraceae bacterium]|nr:type II toxin-antitoxin system HicB family antitoxin [Desulfobacteraceae bacterium]HPJ67813.1 type II toxin-antitoxin system HicB family antitoxin [Desulfobacteraceae bacterium]HPQ28029.1 type II toxin-antitoxin system HicB family antitoxin [Desulfobacteraceae bacterium]